jgi:hypothetical protein
MKKGLIQPVSILWRDIARRRFIPLIERFIKEKFLSGIHFDEIAAGADAGSRLLIGAQAGGFHVMDAIPENLIIDFANHHITPFSA